VPRLALFATHAVAELLRAYARCMSPSSWEAFCGGSFILCGSRHGFPCSCTWKNLLQRERSCEKTRHQIAHSAEMVKKRNPSVVWKRPTVSRDCRPTESSANASDDQISTHTRGGWPQDHNSAVLQSSPTLREARTTAPRTTTPSHASTHTSHDHTRHSHHASDGPRSGAEPLPSVVSAVVPAAPPTPS